MERHDRHVHAFIHRQGGGDIPYEDALQAGRIGLWQAIQVLFPFELAVRLFDHRALEPILAAHLYVPSAKDKHGRDCRDEACVLVCRHAAQVCARQPPIRCESP